VRNPRVERLANLFSRGRQLHWRNAAQLAHTHIRPGRYPEQAPPVVTLVYKALQLILATSFLERRAYLEGEALERFGALLFTQVAGPELPRVHRLAETYAQAFDDEARFVALVSRDLCHALTGASRPEHAQALAGAPEAVRKTTHLYCAQVFGDSQVVRRLSAD
jgi:hypothetical protein